jgi:hypothetical protein
MVGDITRIIIGQIVNETGDYESFIVRQQLDVLPFI